MKILLIALSLVLNAPLAFGKVTSSFQILEELPYISTPIAASTKNLTEVKSAQLQAHALVGVLQKKAKRLGLSRPYVHFFQIDLIKNVAVETCLEVSKSNVQKVPATLLKIRPAGKYFVLVYTGPNPNMQKEITDTLKNITVKLKGSTAYQYKTSVLPQEKNSSTFLFPVLE